MRRVIVIVPTYNEAASIEELIGGISEALPKAHILVVDDDSPDGTSLRVRELVRLDSRVLLLERSRKLGLASAYREGFQFSQENGYEVVVEMDADLSHDPAEVRSLVEAVEGGADVALGSRYVEGGVVSGLGPLRRLLSRAASTAARWTLRVPICDWTTGYRAYSRRAVRVVLSRATRSRGFVCQIEALYEAWSSGLTVVERPIVFRHRHGGRSKLSVRIVLEALWTVAALAVSRTPAPRARRANAPSNSPGSPGAQV
jgi:dolichol-phosphate mannosyltransferase